MTKEEYIEEIKRLTIELAEKYPGTDATFSEDRPIIPMYSGNKVAAYRSPGVTLTITIRSRGPHELPMD